MTGKEQSTLATSPRSVGYHVRGAQTPADFAKAYANLLLYAQAEHSQGGEVTLNLDSSVRRCTESNREVSSVVANRVAPSSPNSRDNDIRNVRCSVSSALGHGKASD